MKIAVVGAGVFGLSGAIELQRRGHAVTVFERGPIPHPDASSTDVSKAIRRTWYGDVDTYVELVERAAVMWRDWEGRFPARVYHQCGQLLVLSDFQPGSPMYESYRFLESRGADVEALDATEAKTRFPQFVFDAHETCLYDPWAGYLESGQSLLFMSQMASGLGVQLALDTPVTAIDETTNGVRIQAAVPHDFDLAVVATGVWLGRLVPALTAHVQVSQQQMVFIEVDPDLDRDGTPEFAQRAAEFLRRRIPEMAAGRITGGRSCLYASTPDDHFFIDRAPGSSRVFVAGGGSGHGFKFGGAIGEIVADAVEDRDNPLGAVFRIGNRLAQAEHDRPYRGFATPRADS